MALCKAFPTVMRRTSARAASPFRRQKQRLSLARAILKNPRILILDDCTSALDATTEASVLSMLRKQCSGMTVLLISQRISTVMRTDRILCLEDGRVMGFGAHPGAA